MSISLNIARHMADLDVSISATPDEIELIKGTFATDDDARDRKEEGYIRSRAESGDVLAWANIEIKVEYFSREMAENGLDVVSGTDIIGGCSYDSLEDFMVPAGYYQDMLDTCGREISETLPIEFQAGFNTQFNQWRLDNGLQRYDG